MKPNSRNYKIPGVCINIVYTSSRKIVYMYNITKL